MMIVSIYTISTSRSCSSSCPGLICSCSICAIASRTRLVESEAANKSPDNGPCPARLLHAVPADLHAAIETFDILTGVTTVYVCLTGRVTFLVAPPSPIRDDWPQPCGRELSNDSCILHYVIGIHNALHNATL